MPASRQTSLKSDAFNKNITKRGQVSSRDSKKNQFSVGPVVLSIFLFVVVGSA